MASTRFRSDVGLTMRMGAVMVVLGGLFVAIVVALMYALPPRFAPIVGLVAIGVAFYQWWTSDRVAMRAMRAREVSPDEAPELHGMIDRLCALADMPKPRVAVSDSTIPNAFATGRSPQRAVVCVTKGIMATLTAEELEGVIAHELSHVAHRDVLVMTLASSAGILAGMTMRGTRYAGMARGGRGRSAGGQVAGLMVTLIVSLVVYAVSFLLIRLLSRYRELCADRSGAYLTLNPAALASALQKITGQMSAIPDRDLRASQPMNAFFFAPAIKGLTVATLTATHPSLEQRLEQLARVQTDLERDL